MSPAPDQLKTSAAFLTAVNLACAAIGAAQGLAVVRLLGPEGFGAAAVLVSLTAVATNLIDVRLTDLVSNLYYSPAASGDTSPGHDQHRLLGELQHVPGLAVVQQTSVAGSGQLATSTL